MLVGAQSDTARRARIAFHGHSRLGTGERRRRRRDSAPLRQTSHAPRFERIDAFMMLDILAAIRAPAAEVKVKHGDRRTCITNNHGIRDSALEMPASCISSYRNHPSIHSHWVEVCTAPARHCCAGLRSRSLQSSVVSYCQSFVLCRNGASRPGCVAQASHLQVGLYGRCGCVDCVARWWGRYGEKAFTSILSHQDLLPGFREATVLFGAYVGAEYAYEKYQTKAAKASAGAAAAVAVRDAHAH